MAKHRIASRSQLIGTVVAIFDYSLDEVEREKREDIQWNNYDTLSLSQMIAPLEVKAAKSSRVRNLLRDVRRKENYEHLLDQVSPLDARVCEEFYRKTWWQIRHNCLVGDRRREFGVDQETFAKMIGTTRKSIANFESFHENMMNRSMMFAFTVTQDIPVEKAEEFGRKFRQAYRRHKNGEV